MTSSELYEKYQGHFVDIRLMEEDNFIKTVFTRSWTADHGQIKRSFIYADIVPDGDEEEYLRAQAANPASIQKIPLPEAQIAEVKVGNKIAY